MTEEFSKDEERKKRKKTSFRSVREPSSVIGDGTRAPTSAFVAQRRPYFSYSLLIRPLAVVRHGEPESQ